MSPSIEWLCAIGVKCSWFQLPPRSNETDVATSWWHRSRGGRRRRRSGGGGGQVGPELRIKAREQLKQRLDRRWRLKAVRDPSNGGRGRQVSPNTEIEWHYRRSNKQDIPKRDFITYKLKPLKSKQRGLAAPYVCKRKLKAFLLSDHPALHPHTFLSSTAQGRINPAAHISQDFTTFTPYSLFSLSFITVTKTKNNQKDWLTAPGFSAHLLLFWKRHYLALCRAQHNLGSEKNLFLFIQAQTFSSRCSHSSSNVKKKKSS